jgi:hypothetical protein
LVLPVGKVSETFAQIAVNRLIKNQFDGWFRQAAFNVAIGMKVFSRIAV